MKSQPKLVVSADMKPPTPVDPKAFDCEFGIGSVVQVLYEGKGIYGMVKWMGYILDKSKIIVGIESVSIYIFSFYIVCFVQNKCIPSYLLNIYECI